MKIDIIYLFIVLGIVFFTLNFLLLTYNKMRIKKERKKADNLEFSIRGGDEARWFHRCFF